MSAPPPGAPFIRESAAAKTIRRMAWLAVATCFVASSAEMYAALRSSEETRLVGATAALLLAIFSAFVLMARASLATHIAERSTWAQRALLFAILCWAAFVVAQFAVNGWDEGAYVATGLAWLGEPVRAATQRAPMTGLLIFAAFGHAAWLNAALTLVLASLVVIAAPRARDVLMPSAALAMVFANDQVLMATLDSLSELPAAVFVLSAFVALAGQRPGSAALLLALASLTRFNLAPVAVVVSLFVWAYFGFRTFARFALIGVAVSALGAASLLRFSGDPLGDVLTQYVPSVAAWTDAEGNSPTFLSRALFYGFGAWFVGPVVIVLLATTLFRARGNSATTAQMSWVWHACAPTALATYAGAMLFIGPTFARFMTPVVPLAVVCSLYALQNWAVIKTDAHLRTQAILIVAALSIAWTLHPMTFALVAKGNLSFVPAIAEADATNLRAKVAPEEIVYLYPTEQVALANGHPTMIALRRRTFVMGDRDRHNTPTGSSLEPVALIEAEVPSGSLVLMPSEFEPASERLERVVNASDHTLWRWR